MGDKKVTADYDESQMRAFTVAVLNDLRAFETMLDEGIFEHGVRRIGAEQEMFLVDSAMHPAPIALEVIAEAKDPRLTTEIGKFNLEANPPPLRFGGRCLADMENDLNDVLNVVRRTASKFDAGVVMAGILPTIQRSDLTLANLTPDPRYFEINRVVTELHGDNRFIQIKGLDELQLLVQDTSIEFCNTSFQVHLQVDADELSNSYNWSQAVAAPVLAAAVNSPLLLNNRLWNETRIALFQHATDTRSPAHQQRRQTPRVNFGERWADDSIMDMMREDAVRYRFLLTRSVEEDSMNELANGRIPTLPAWRMHNGTIWRWNRVCFGVIEGRPNLRIEARFLPAGPSVADEMANAAFFLGLLTEMPVAYGDVRQRMSFDDAKHNFYAAARYGLRSQVRWFDGNCRMAADLIRGELLPIARAGLDRAGIDSEDSDRLLGIIDERVVSRRTGAKWMIESLENMDRLAKPNVRMRSLTAAMKKNQEEGKPAHLWELASIPDHSDWIDNYKIDEQFMATDLYTVRTIDVLDLAASLMHWRRVRHVPVEDDSGRLVGLVSHRDIISLFAEGKAAGAGQLIVKDVMKTDLITITPTTSALEALRLMREKRIGCLPVLDGEKLVGVLTAHDFLTVSTKLFEERLTEIDSHSSAPNLHDEAKDDPPDTSDLARSARSIK
jgi:CBS domain-containing protein/gamma-glutamylcysteine synthetase